MKVPRNNVVMFLEADGFKYGNSDITFYRRTKHNDTKDCLCNDKTPQIGIKSYSFKLPYSTSCSYEIGLIQENDLGWVNLSFYGLNEDQLISNLPKYEAALIRAWEATFDVKGELK
jgi:hypothetical protein